MILNWSLSPAIKWSLITKFASNPETTYHSFILIFQTLRELSRTMKWSEVAQSCPTLCDPINCSLPGSSVHGIFQAIVLEWIAISFSSGSSWPRDQTQIFHIAGRFFTIWATREAPGLTILVTKADTKNGDLLPMPLGSTQLKGGYKC